MKHHLLNCFPKLLCAFILACGSCTPCKVIPPPGLTFTIPLPPESPASDEITAKTLSAALESADAQSMQGYPLIDIHTHSFNALYLPIMQIARGRTQELRFGWVLSETVGWVLATAILNKTQENQSGRFLTSPKLAMQRINEPGAKISDVLGITSDNVLDGGRNLLNSTENDGLPRLSRLDVTTILDTNTNWERFGKAVFGIEDDTSKIHGTSLKEKLVAFLAVLTSNDAAIRQQMRDAYEGQVSLCVQHTMDMGPTYDQHPGKRFLDYQKRQMPRVRELDLLQANRGHFLHFASFSPYRSEREQPLGGWKESQAIKLVEENLRKGAWGVKYYPPAGYRASDNIIPDFASRGLLPVSQRNARYHDFTPAKLDDLNMAFFEFCAENNIPVFAHCGPGEFQAANCYGETMAHPFYYKKVLDALQNRPRPLNLRLCLGHAGGPDFWFDKSSGQLADWGRQVFELCVKYPHVYCEVGILSDIAQPELKLRFAKRIATLINIPAAQDPDFPGKSRTFGNKLIYGTDWFMPDAAGLKVSFLNEYRSVFIQKGISDHYDNFFSQNALHFLGAIGNHRAAFGGVSEMQSALEKLILP